LAPPEEAGDEEKARLHPRYQDYETSGLKCTINPGLEDRLRFEVGQGS
jgi:hypothetical protein